jgi:uroporphyrinogen-III decarboxylase
VVHGSPGHGKPRIREAIGVTGETMDAHERVLAALALEPVDRHPVFPIMVTAGPRLRGITQGEAWRDHDAAREALIWCFEEFGYDYGSKPNYYYPMLPGKLCGAPVRNLIPGRQLGEDSLYQIDERVLFPREDYDRIAALGWNAYWEEHYEQMSGKATEKLIAMQTLSNELYDQDMKICEEQGMPIFLGAAVDSVMMAFSLCRTLSEFTRDLFEVPDKVEAAMRASCDDLISNAIQVCRNNGKMLAFVVLERGSGAYYRLETFERFEWPWLKAYVDAFISEGITPWLHFDTDWSLNIPYLKRLPAGKCICDLDGMTDIFAAKEILPGQARGGRGLLQEADRRGGRRRRVHADYGLRVPGRREAGELARHGRDRQELPW